MSANVFADETHLIGTTNVLDRVFSNYRKVALLYCLNLKRKFDTVIYGIKFNSMPHEKFYFVLNLIHPLSISILFSLEAIQKMQKLPTLCITVNHEQQDNVHSVFAFYALSFIMQTIKMKAIAG